MNSTFEIYHIMDRLEKKKISVQFFFVVEGKLRTKLEHQCPRVFSTLHNHYWRKRRQIRMISGQAILFSQLAKDERMPVKYSPPTN